MHLCKEGLSVRGCRGLRLHPAGLAQHLYYIQELRYAQQSTIPRATSACFTQPATGSIGPAGFC